MKKIFIIFLVIVLASCKNTWNEDGKATWKQACMEDARKWTGNEDKASTYCDCALPKIILKYPNEDDALEQIGVLVTDTGLIRCKSDAMK